MTNYANKVSSDGTIDNNGDRKCVAPPSHLGVYFWSVVMEHNVYMRVKGTVAIPPGVRSEGQVGGSRAAALKRKTTHQGLGAIGQEDQHSVNDEGSHRLRAKKKKKIKAHAHDHIGATFLDDGKSGKSTRAARESSMIAVLGELAPPKPTALDVAHKRRGQLLDEDQVLLQYLGLAQNALKSTDPHDVAEVLWVNGKIAKLRAAIDKAETNRESNAEAIRLLEDEQEERDRAQGRRQKFLSSLEHTDGTGSIHDGDSTGEDSQ